MSSIFTQTESGQIPSEWEVRTLADVCRMICDGTHFTPRYVPYGIPFYSVENVTARDFFNCKYITEEEHLKLIKRCKPSRGDILMTRITAGIVGDTYLIDWEVNASIYVSLALLRPNESIDPRYLYSYSRSPAFVRDVEKRALVNATPKKINMRDIGAIPLPVPRNIAEQRSIAAALSDVDELIGALDKLITKKRAIKLATIHQLLTGKTRLPGFREKWKVRRLGEMLSFLKTANSPRRDFTNEGEVRYIHYGDVHAHGTPVLDCSATELPMISKRKVSSATQLMDGDLILVDASEDMEGVGKSIEVANLAGSPVVAGLHTIACRGEDSNWTIGFKAYLQFIPAFKQGLERVATGISVYAISKRKIADVELPLPNVAEQKAIVSVLADMESEINILEQRRNKTIAVKQGMMQSLLTGRIRLFEKSGVDIESDGNDD